ncbi:MAG: LptF/LptG family permease [Phycisphaerae bacterium]|nr:LptF/LptG family permease [Phycisphaerae bacterium]
MNLEAINYFCCKKSIFDDNNCGIIMVFILHRYIFRELLKVFVLSAVALSVIMSLGSLLRPIQEYGVGPAQVVDLLGYFLPITMTFVLPVAALFATSLVYGRFAADNEFDACKASGISPAMLVYPGLILAIVVAIANLILSFHIVPAYVHRAESSIKADAKQILFRNIHRQGYYNLPGGQFRIYADAADAKSSSLFGVVIMDTEKGINRKLITAESATINFDSSSGGASEVKVFAKNAFQFDQYGGIFFKAISVIGQFASLMKDDVKFKKIEQINAIKTSPITYYPIAVTAWDAYERMAMELLAGEISKVVAEPNNNFYQLYNKDKLIRFSGKNCSIAKEQNQIKLTGEVSLFEYDRKSGELLKSYKGQELFLQLSTETEKRPSTLLIITFPNALWLDRGVEYVKPRYTAQELSLPGSVMAKLGEDVIATVEQHKYIPQPSPQLAILIQDLSRKIRVTFLEIEAEIHSRLVFGIGCISLILSGIGLGIRFRGGHLLTAFGVSSIPAAVLLIFIMAGKNITKNQSSEAGAGFGVAFMWIGLLVLTIYAFVLYRKLLRN